MQPSPYTPGQAATQVPGRTSQLAQIDERLAYMTGAGALIGRIRVDIAARGMGKTSLLREVQRRAEQQRVMTLWVTAGENHDVVEAVAYEIDRATRNWTDPAKRSIREALESATLTVGVPGLAKVEATVRPGQPKAPGGARAFEVLLQRTVDSAVQSGHTGTILLIDEVQAADPASLRTLAYAWQHLQSEAPRLQAGVFAVGLPNSPEVIADAVTFSERFLYRTLPALNRDDSAIALAAPARAVGVEWAPEALAQAIDFAAGYPYTIQLIGEATWSAAGRPDRGGWITAEHTSAARAEVEIDLDALFRARWERATPAEQHLLVAMAHLGDVPQRRGDIAAAMGVGTDGIGVARARLIDKGLIQPAGHGELEFSIPQFGHFVRTFTDRRP